MAEVTNAVARKLERWLDERGEANTVEVTGRATVGLSQETWFATVRSTVGEREVVLRLPTPSSGGKAVLHQRVALAAVAGRVPAPSLVWHDDSEDNPFGRPFLVMERVAGEVPVGWHELPEPRRTALAEDALGVLAALHAIDPTPLDGKAGASATELEFYRRRLERLDDLPSVLKLALWWLERHRPASDGFRGIVHGDYRMGNMVVAGDRIAGVLDWEMAGVGDPLSDLAWCFIPVYELPGVDEVALVQRYGELTGRPIDPERLRWHRVLGYVRLAYYAIGGSRGFATGRSDDLRLAALALLAPVHLDRLAATLAGEEPT